MTTLDRRQLIVGAGAAALSGCAATQVADAPKEEPRGGIGGTGIVGVLVDFGSIVINGLRVETGAYTAVEGPLGPISLSDLAVGQALTVEAETIDGALRAARIFVADPLIGTIEEISPDGRRLVVNGVDAVLDEGAPARGAAGDRVAVSGLWRGGEVAASRVALAPPGPDAIAGVAGRDAVGRPTVGGRPTAHSPNESAPPEGSFTVALGASTGDVFRVAKATSGRFTGAAGPLSRLSVEGYLDPIAAAPFYSVAGLGHSFDAGAKLEPFAGARTLYSGTYTGDFAVETGLVLPEGVAERRALLETFRRTGAAPAGALRRAR